MDVLDAIRNRRSIKPEKMKSDPVDRRLLEAAFDAANWAPSHGHTEPWRFIVFENDARARLCEAVCATISGGAPVAPDDPRRMKIAGKMMRAPVIVAIVCQADPSPKIVEHEEIAATAIAVQNMHLALRSFGLAGYWSSGSKAFHPIVAAFLGITPPARCLGFFYIGWPAIPWPDGERGPVASKVTWNG
jgi:nitroreductase